MNNWFLASAVPAPIQTPNTGWSLLPLACLVVDIAGKNVVEHVVNQDVRPLFALLATKEVHGVNYDAQEALDRNVAGLVGFKPLAFYTRIFYESFSEPLDAFRSREETRHKLSFWACL